jgi:hypothetical protein
MDETPALAEILDRAAIEDLIRRYADAMTRADWEQHEALFAPDIVLETAPPFTITLRGRDELIDRCKFNSTRVDFMIQMSHSWVVTLLGPDSARATSTTHELARFKEEVGPLTFADGTVSSNFEYVGIYYDNFVKIDGRWLFAKRFCQPVYAKFGGLDGPTIMGRDGLLALRAPG